MERIERLQYITLNTNPDKILTEVRGVLDGGCKWIQLRMKESSEEIIIEVGREIKKLCTEFDAKLIINDNPSICKAIDADGVHLGNSDISTLDARKILGDKKIIGRTCNTLSDIITINHEQVNYIGLGPLRFTTTKKLLSPEIGLDGYGIIASQTKLPIIAVGGITLSDIRPLLNQGVHGVAVAGVIAKSENIKNTTKDILNLINNEGINNRR